MAFATESAHCIYIQPEDVFFISSHDSPFDVRSSTRRAFLATGNGVLVYDYLKRRWADNWETSGRLEAIRYDSSRDELYALVDGSPMMYNETFRRFVPADSFPDDSSTPRVPMLSGTLTMEEGYFFSGNTVRDPYMQHAPILAVREFAPDHLWILTKGLGAFLGSSDHKRVESVWFGLERVDLGDVFVHENRIWFGSRHPQGTLIEAGLDLQNWRRFPSPYVAGFPNGVVHDMVYWKDHLWLGTDHGVTRMASRGGNFLNIDFFDGLRSDRVRTLLPTPSGLYAGGEEGLHLLDAPGSGFRALPGPDGFTRDVNGLAACSDSVLVAAQYGLFQVSRGNWSQVTELMQGLEIQDVACVGGRPYWLQGGRVLARGAPRKDFERVFDRGGAFRLESRGKYLFVGHDAGVTLYDTESRLWSDFEMGDEVPGIRLLSFAQSEHHLWMATDKGVSRVRLAPYLP